MILFGCVFFSIELRLMTRSAYEHRGWEPWGIFTGTYGKGRFFVAGPLLVEFMANERITRPYICVF